MSTFSLKHLRGEEDYSYTSMAQQELHLLLQERQMTEQIQNQIYKQHRDPIKHLLHQAAPDYSNRSSSDELPVSTYSHSDTVEAAAATTRSSAAFSVAPSLPVALETIPARVPVDPSRAFLSLGRCCPVFHMLHGALQAFRTAMRSWTRFWISQSLLWPRTYFRGRAYRIN